MTRVTVSRSDDEDGKLQAQVNDSDDDDGDYIASVECDTREEAEQIVGIYNAAQDGGYLIV